MADLTLLQAFIILGAVGASISIITNALFDVFVRQAFYRGWNALD